MPRRYYIVSRIAGEQFLIPIPTKESMLFQMAPTVLEKAPLTWQSTTSAVLLSPSRAKLRIIW